MRVKSYYAETAINDYYAVKARAENAIGSVLTARGWTVASITPIATGYCVRFLRSVARERSEFFAVTEKQWDEIRTRFEAGKKRIRKPQERDLSAVMVAATPTAPATTADYLCLECGCETPKADKCCFVCGAANPEYGKVSVSLTDNQRQLLLSLVLAAAPTEQTETMLSELAALLTPKESVEIL